MYAAQPLVLLGPVRYLLILIAFALGLMAKQMLVTLPFVLLLLDYWPLGRLRGIRISSLSRLILEKLPFFMLLSISIYVSFHISVKKFIPLEVVPVDLRIANALVTYVSYIEKMIWPLNLAVYYPYP